MRLITRIAFGCTSPDALIALAMLTLGGHEAALPGRDQPTDTTGEPRVGSISRTRPSDRDDLYERVTVPRHGSDTFPSVEDRAGSDAADSAS